MAISGHSINLSHFLRLLLQVISQETEWTLMSVSARSPIMSRSICLFVCLFEFSYIFRCVCVQCFVNTLKIFDKGYDVREAFVSLICRSDCRPSSADRCHVLVTYRCPFVSKRNNCGDLFVDKPAPFGTRNRSSIALI